MVGDAGNAPVRRFQSYFTTSGLQPGNWIISREGAGQVVGSGGGSCTHGDGAYEARLNLIRPAVKIGGVGG